MSELFTSPDRPLVVYQMMYGKAQTEPCPMCTLWVDGLNGVAHHLRQHLDPAVVMAAGPVAIRGHARARGWRNLRLLSAGSSSFKYDFGSEDEQGAQEPAVSVFSLEPDGHVQHRYTTSRQLSDEVAERGIDLLSPVWQVLDLTPQGRGDWYASLDYGPARR